MGRPTGYLITFSTYGSWLHGDYNGSVDDEHNCSGQAFVDGNPERQVFERQEMKSPVFLMDHPMRELSVNTVIEICNNRNWHLYAVHVRTNHVHIVINSQEKPEKMMSNIKTWVTRKMRETFPSLGKRKLWTRHGSTKYLWDENSLLKAIEYTVEGQGEMMSFYRKND